MALSQMMEHGLGPFICTRAAIHLIGRVVSLRSRAIKQESVPPIDTFGCARFHPFGNGKPQKRAGPAARERRKPWRRQAPPFPESVIHRALAFQAQIPRQSRQRVADRRVIEYWVTYESASGSWWRWWQRRKSQFEAVNREQVEVRLVDCGNLRLREHGRSRD